MGSRAVSRVALWIAIIAALCARANCDSVTLTQGVSVRLEPAAKLSVPAVLPLLGAGATFSPFFGSLTVSYRLRTSPAGAGAITLQAASDFAPAGGPSIAAGALTYTCAGSTLGTACTGQESVATGAQSPVLAVPGGACTGGGGACSAANPNTTTVSFTLENDSSARTGNYAAQITFVVSAI